MSKYEIVRTWKDGKQLIAAIEDSKSGLFGYGGDSPDKNRYLLFPDGTFKAHIYCGFLGNRDGQELEFEGKTYIFAGYY